MAAIGREAADGRGSIDRKASPEIREVLLGSPSDHKFCESCSKSQSVTEWVVQITIDDEWVSYVGRCPVCDQPDNHYIVDPIRE